MVSSPVRIQVNSSPPAEPVCREISAATMKMPDPIIEPTTIIVPSNKPMARTKPCSDFALVSARGCVVSAIRRIASAGRRVVRGFEKFDILPRPLLRIGREEDITDDSHGVGARLNDFNCALQCDTTDRHNRLLGQRPNFANHFDSN